MNEQEILSRLRSVGAIITESHIVYTSGNHGSMYINKDALYPHTKETSALCRVIAEHFASDPIDVVLAPALGGIILSQWTAHHLSEITGREILSVYAEKLDNDFVIKRGYDKFVTGKNILILEDILTTGGSVKKVAAITRALNAHVIGVGALCNRGNVSLEDLGDVPKLFSLLTMKLDAWEEGNCPLCRDHIPININVGKGREFLVKKEAARK
ncbi:MAG: phosphoribosyltransferase family protein [Chthoniobacterales bacterium]